MWETSDRGLARGKSAPVAVDKMGRVSSVGGSSGSAGRNVSKSSTPSTSCPRRDVRECQCPKSSSWSCRTRLRKIPSAAMSASTLFTEWITVEWSRPPNSVPMSE